MAEEALTSAQAQPGLQDIEDTEDLLAEEALVLVLTLREILHLKQVWLCETFPFTLKLKEN